VVAVARPPSQSRVPPGSPQLNGDAPDGTQRESHDGAAHWLACAGLATVGYTGIRSGVVTLSDFFFSASTMVIIINLLSGARRRLATREVRATSPSLLIGLAILTLGGLLATLLRSIDPFGSGLSLLRIWYITVIWFWTIRSVSTSLASFKRLLLAAIVGAVVHAGIGVYQDVSGANAVYPTWGRSRGYSDHFGDLASSVGSLLPVLAVWPTQGKGRNIELLRWFAILVMLGGIGSTGSMSITGASILGVLVAVLLPRMLGARRTNKRRLGVPLVAGAVAVAVISMGAVQLSVLERFGELGMSDSQVSWSAGSRVNMTKVAIDGAAASPLVGVGLDERSGGAANKYDNSTSTPKEQNIHNLYLRLLFEAGILGAAGLLLILFVITRQGLQLVRYLRESSLAWIPAGLMGALVAICSAALFGPALYTRIMWLPMAFLSALAGLARARLLPVSDVAGNGNGGGSGNGSGVDSNGGGAVGLGVGPYGVLEHRPPNGGAHQPP
jgi:O-antigen ligase